MKVVIPSAATRTLEDRIDEWRLVVARWTEDIPESYWIAHDHWLGWSRDGAVWGLATNNSRRGIDHFKPDFRAFLLDPPQRDFETISNILLAVHKRGLVGSVPDEAEVERLIEGCPFPEDRTLKSLMPNAPADWLDLPARIGWDVVLSEGASMSSTLLREFRCETMMEVMAAVTSRRIDGLLLYYSVYCPEVVPLLAWDIDWPLARQGKDNPQRRGKVQGAYPWEEEADASLFTVRQSAPYDRSMTPKYYAAATVRLQVGGRTPDEAVRNWHRVAKSLRATRRMAAELGISPRHASWT